jgi:alpha-tubulin suppressor-like RCC1 family protein
MRVRLAVALSIAPACLRGQPIGVALGDSAQIRIAPGSAVVVPVRLELRALTTASVASLGGTVTWASTRLRLDSVRASEAGWTVTANTDSAAAGRISVSLYSPSALTATATIARLFYTATGNPGGTRVRLTPTAAGSELGANVLDSLATRPLDACVSPSGRWGDVSDDGVVNVIDAQQIARFSVGLPVGNAVALDGRGDVNADAAVNVIDAQQIARFSVQLAAAQRINTMLFVDPDAQGLALSPGVALVVAQGRSLQLVGDPQDGTGGSIAGCAPLTYASESPGVTTVSSTGVVTGIAPGQSWMSVQTTGGQRQRLLVRVTLPSGVFNDETFASGENHSCAIAVAGPTYCWGDNRSGQLGDGTTGSRSTPTLVSGGLSFTMLVATGINATTCGLTSAGNSYCWGSDSQLRGRASALSTAPVAVAGDLTFVSIAASSLHLCGLTASGTAYCWGYNQFGQLGDGTTRSRSAPSAVSGAPAFVALTTGSFHTCGLAQSGAVYCWGYNGLGALGDGTTTTRTTPVQVSGAQRFVSIQGGDKSTCGLAVTGGAFCWGAGGKGQLGNGIFNVTSANPTPVAVSLPGNLVRLSGRYRHFCALNADGLAYCWGENLRGKLGDSTVDNRAVPTPVNGGRTWRSITVGYNSTCGVASTGTALCWGNNEYGELGNGSRTVRTTPVAVRSASGFTELSAGYAFACGIVASGPAYCWGANEYGQLGDGTLVGRSVPIQIAGGFRFAKMTAGNYHACGQDPAGTVFCSGSNAGGQLGDGTTTSRAVPGAITGSLSFGSINAGWNHTCGLVAARAYCWGGNLSGQLGDGTTVRKSLPTAVADSVSFRTLGTGSNHSCGLTELGAAYCWGHNVYGQLGDGTTYDKNRPVTVTGNFTFSTLAVGDNLTCGLTTAGLAYCWGKQPLCDFTLSECITSSPQPVEGGLAFTAIGVAQNHACALTTTGAAYCWGLNTLGQLGTDAVLSSTSPVAVSGGYAFTRLDVGGEHTCGLTAAGTAYCWGLNSDGQLGNNEVFPLTPVPVVANGIVFRTP